MSSNVRQINDDEEEEEEETYKDCFRADKCGTESVYKQLFLESNTTRASAGNDGSRRNTEQPSNGINDETTQGCNTKDDMKLLGFNMNKKDAVTVMNNQPLIADTTVPFKNGCHQENDINAQGSASEESYTAVVGNNKIVFRNKREAAIATLSWIQKQKRNNSKRMRLGGGIRPWANDGDETKPKTNSSAFLLYMAAHMPRIRYETPNALHTERLKIINEEYRSISAEERHRWGRNAVADKARYAREMALYNNKCSDKNNKPGTSASAKQEREKLSEEC